MNELLSDISIGKLFLTLLPVILIQVGLMIFCIIKIMKDGVGNLTPIAWIVIVVFVNMLGPILYLILGRKTDDYSEESEEELW